MQFRRKQRLRNFSISHRTIGLWRTSPTSHKQCRPASLAVLLARQQGVDPLALSVKTNRHPHTDVPRQLAFHLFHHSDKRPLLRRQEKKAFVSSERNNNNKRDTTHPVRMPLLNVAALCLAALASLLARPVAAVYYGGAVHVASSLQ